VCFCDAESVLSAVAKFLVQLLREGEGRGEMEEGDRERERAARERNMEVREMGIAPKGNKFGIWGSPWVYPRVIHFRKLFSMTAFPSRIVCLKIK